MSVCEREVPMSPPSRSAGEREKGAGVAGGLGPKTKHPSKNQSPPHRLSQEVLKYVRKLADAVKKEPLVAR